MNMENYSSADFLGNYELTTEGRRALFELSKEMAFTIDVQL
jgi:hypothetical protein